ncbi:alcohol dehydrogenase catalytic domain-containing protein [Naasia aerilata]|uniref:Alcohol dehydrogenase-like N-terminal domain-containing protein n=1 Tax=Naasia aerilata TaxID=1162966 RepID=A0ABN6XP38_9MICO|nr:hypothetical protein [Naasia aerilata]BDZ45436.1 hypothetical protein GCM10025866_13450 [Naasia aerilata]
MSYRAILVEEGTPPRARVTSVEGPRLTPPDPVRIEVSHSSVNYKDAVALTGGPGILRSLPMVPGIDAVGTLAEDSGTMSASTPVLVNGAGLGERTDGGLAESVLATADAVLPVPDGMSARDAAAIGTAGFTAALAALALQRHGVEPGDGEVLVTGSGGGVGSFAVSLLAALGYSVVASTGRISERGPALTELGATEVVDRATLGTAGSRCRAHDGRPWSTRWAASASPMLSPRPATAESSPPAGWPAAPPSLPRCCPSSSAR